ncbi:hypothetical protein B0H11DRAFT_201745 [Mycena galericulata]|nr:hypothetical protein B0H11DRAFT_201745 [Mycena galericulata]
MPELFLQLLPLALAPLVALVSNGIQRGIILGLAGAYIGWLVLRLNLPNVRMQKLEKYIEDTIEIHATAVRELERDPRFVTETGLRLAQVKLYESVLRSKQISGKDIGWKGYLKHLRCLSFHIGECQREVQNVRTLILATLESSRQRGYKEDIIQRQTTLDTMYLRGCVCVLGDPAVDV